ncbi:RDD family protein [Acidicapsa ligni]|uniref:RDD family protein n=1 Tax=Acidicapsa ligni TaxID=542300 RepID=UPI0021DF8D1E|nr:RDD family protein [Acidicapsa ligni]
MEPEWDQLSIDTPELVAIEMPVAGIGSRFVALLVDYLIWVAAIAVLLILIALVDPSLSRFSKIGEKWASALFILALFLLYWGYFTLFEAFWNGRTPGKRVAKIRVIQKSGRGIGLFEAMTRNLLRIVDQFPGVYAVGVVCIFLNKEHQRLGDLAAGTLVVHERENLEASGAGSSGRTFTAGMFDAPTAFSEQATGTMRTIKPKDFDVAASGIQRLGPSDLELLEGFFARRLDFSMEMRASLAQRIADGILAKTGLTMPQGVSVETFLEEVARQLRDLVRIQ